MCKTNKYKGKRNEKLNLKYILTSLISLYSDPKEIKVKKYCSNLPNGITISTEHKLYTLKKQD